MAASTSVALREPSEIASDALALCTGRQSPDEAVAPVLISSSGRYQLRRLTPICNAPKCSAPAEVEWWTQDHTGKPLSYMGMFCAKHGVQRMASNDWGYQHPGWTGFNGERAVAS